MENIWFIIKAAFRKLLGSKYFITCDYGSPDGDCSILWRKDRNGKITIEKFITTNKL
jgi:hypothetical protein